MKIALDKAEVRFKLHQRQKQKAKQAKTLAKAMRNALSSFSGV